MYTASGTKAYAQVSVESAVMSASPHQLIEMLFDGANSAPGARSPVYATGRYRRQR